MDAYERSLKQQADRIRRELSQEGKKAEKLPKAEKREEFVPSDVPSPIFGYARPKPKINLPVGQSPETREALSVDETEMDKTLDSSKPSTETVAREDAALDAELSLSSETPVVESIVETVTSVVDEPTLEEVTTEETSAPKPDLEQTNISPETQLEASDDKKPLLGDVSILGDGFASVFMGSTDLKSSKVVVREERAEVASEDVSVEPVSVEEVAPIVEDVAKTLQNDDTDAGNSHDEAGLTSAITVSYKAESPPLNVMMTPQDRMAMYRSRRLAQKNNNL